MDAIPRYEDTTFTPEEQAVIRSVTAELQKTHPSLNATFVRMLAQAAAVCSEAELDAMLR
jgi:hypothetical protein